MKKLRFRLRNKYKHKLTPEDLRGYRNILKLLYHKDASTPLKDPDYPKYFIHVPKIHLHLIIDEDRAEIINTKQIYPLNLDKEVYQRAIKMIKKEVTKQRFELEMGIKDKKQTILNKLYNQIN